MTTEDKYHGLLGQSINVCWLRFQSSYFQKIVPDKFSVNRDSIQAYPVKM